jgi:predicted Zn-dependent protease
VLLGKDRSINAFALPGGWMGLHLGLVGVTATRDELASVLAHELSHVTQRHISRLISQQTRQTPLMIGAMILGALAASKNAEAGNAVMAGGTALAMQNQLNFSRDMEREADRIGFGVLTQAGFEPQGFATMFEKLQQSARYNDNGAFPYLRTHPMTTERMADMQSRVAGARTPPAPDMEHALMSARARVISNGSVDALRSHVSEAGSAAALPPARQAAAYYAAAFASAKLRDSAAVQQWLARLQAVTQGDAKGARQARLLAAELASTQGDYGRAASLLDPASRARPELLMLAQAQLATQRPGDAAQRLQTWVTDHPQDATAWQLLARAYTAMNQPLRAIRAEAEAHVAVYDYQAAVDRFKAAQDLARKGAGSADHIEASIIDTRARQVESLLREQALER